MKKTCTILLLFFFATSIFAQNISYNKGKILQKHYLQKIPYEKVKGVPVIPVTINGKTYKFIFDTGAGTVAISDTLCKELNLPITGQKMIGGSSGEQKLKKTILLPELHLQEIEFTNISGIVASELFHFFECFDVHGLIGSSMLKNSVVHFDEQNQRVIITYDIKNLSVQTKVRQKMELSTHGRPFITVVLRKGNKKAVNKVLFDSGQSSFYCISMRVFNWQIDNIVEKISESEGAFSFGIHGLYENQKHTLLNVPEIIANKVTFNNVVIITTHGDFSRIGAELLQYGKTTLDYKKKRFYFEPYDNVDKNKLSEAWWAVQITIQNDKMMVGIIWDKTLETQINLGDEILSINGIDLQSMDFCELLQFENSRSGDELGLVLKDIKTGEVKEVKIKRMQLSK